MLQNYRQKKKKKKIQKFPSSIILLGPQKP